MRETEIKKTTQTEEIYSLSISPVIIGRFAVQWSDDNQISVFTEKGIYVFDIIPSPMSLQPSIKFCRSFIYPPSNIPGEDIVAKASEWMWYLNRQQLYSLLLDEHLTPKLEDFAATTVMIRSAAWSPANLLYSNRCLFAILTSTGALLILHKLCNEWYPAYDLSALREKLHPFQGEQIQLQQKEINVPDHVVTAFKNGMKKLQALSMVWSPMLKNFAYIGVSYRSGDLVIYKIPQILDSLREIPLPEMVMEINLGHNDRVATLHWITISSVEFLIVIGYHDGRIYGMQIKEENATLNVVQTEKYYDFIDRVKVKKLSTMSQTKNSIQIIACKESFVFLIQTTNTGKLKSIQHQQVKGLSISGVSILEDNRAILITENGVMLILNAKTDKLALIEVKHHLSRTATMYLGLTHSRNYAFLLTVSSPSMVYDHLVVKEPSKVQLFHFIDDDWAPASILTRKKNERLANVWDCLERLRLKAIKHQDPVTLFPSMPTNFDQLPLRELRIAMWTSVILGVCEKKQSIRDFDSITGEISEAQPLIFVYTACDYLERLSKKSVLTEQEKAAANSLCMHLEIFLAGEENDDSPVCKRAQEAYEIMGKRSSKKLELCAICGKVLEDLPWKTNKCPDGHILPRCAITLLQITNLQYKCCPICGQIFHLCVDEMYGETRCLLCDVPAITDGRILKLKDISEKSLSKAPIRSTETSGEGEMDQID